MRWVWRFLRYLTGNCEVCGGSKGMQLRFAEGPRSLRHLSVVIPCPHCTSPGELLANLPARGSAPSGGDAA